MHLLSLLLLVKCRIVNDENKCHLKSDLILPIGLQSEMCQNVNLYVNNTVSLVK